MSRIKIRVSAGIFEVSLVRVIEESKSVEVLWDRGIRREFKWGSVVFGNLEGQTIGQKPTEAAPEPERAYLPPRKFCSLSRVVTQIRQYRRPSYLSPQGPHQSHRLFIAPTGLVLERTHTR